MLFQHMRSFLHNVFSWVNPPLLLRHVFHINFFALFARLPHAIMGTRIDSKAIGPRKRQMVHLKTKEECRLGNETLQVWTVELPSKHAEGILRAIKENIEGQDAIDLQHLRRFAKPKYLPDHVLGERDRVKELYDVPRGWDAAPLTVIQAASATWEWSGAPPPRMLRATSAKPTTLYLLVCPVGTISLQDLHDMMLQYPPFCSSADSWAYPLQIKEVTVPRLAPTTPEQAEEWSQAYWPTFYRKTNPFGAHPTAISKSELELHTPAENNISVEQAMDLAEQAGIATEAKGYSDIATGCVIVERFEDQTEIIAVAGDGRRKPLPRENGYDPVDVNVTPVNSIGADSGLSGTELSKAKRKRERKKANKKAARGTIDAEKDGGCCSGNVMSHAVMRAIGMVGRKRLRVASPPASSAAAKAESNFAAVGLEHDETARDAFFLDLPVTPLEQEYFAKDNLRPDGYLCLKLEVFLTHEPCMMCSMALVHSRVGRVIFQHRMPKTGGLTAEATRNDSGPVGLGYGLCWRKELNWQFMCWEYAAAHYGAKQGHGDGNEDDSDDDDYAFVSDDHANDGKLSFTSVCV